jgi:cell shape-determining protein MreC
MESKEREYLKRIEELERENRMLKEQLAFERRQNLRDANRRNTIT